MGDLILIKNKLKKLKEENQQDDSLPTQLYTLTGVVSPFGKRIYPVTGFFVRNILDDEIFGHAMDFAINGWMICNLTGEMTEKSLEFMLSIASPSGNKIKSVDYSLHLSNKLLHVNPEFYYWEGLCLNGKKERAVRCQTELYVSDASKIHF